MAYPQQAQYIPAVNADDDVRSAFLVRVYQHVALAVLAFVVFETALFVTGLADAIHNIFTGERGGLLWLGLLGAFWIGGTIASNAATRIDNVSAQYTGLFGMAALYSVVFAPLLTSVFNADAGVLVWQAGVITLIGFAGLTVIGMTTSKDLSFMRPIMMWGGFVALGLIVAGIIFGFGLGVWFSVGMIALMGASILYQTQTIVRQFPSWAHVAAALGLFSSLMTLFYYVVRLLGATRR
jgi:FtsH-binding integral membrane protein